MCLMIRRSWLWGLAYEMNICEEYIKIFIILRLTAVYSGFLIRCLLFLVVASEFCEEDRVTY